MHLLARDVRRPPVVGAPRAGRSALIAATALTLASGGHLAAGGSASPALLAVLAFLGTWGLAAIAVRRQLTLLRAAVWLAGLQLLVHEFLTRAGHPAPGAAPGSLLATVERAALTGPQDHSQHLGFGAVSGLGTANGLSTANGFGTTSGFGTAPGASLIDTALRHAELINTDLINTDLIDAALIRPLAASHAAEHPSLSLTMLLAHLLAALAVAPALAALDGLLFLLWDFAGRALASIRPRPLPLWPRPCCRQRAVRPPAAPDVRGTCSPRGPPAPRQALRVAAA